MEIRFGLAVVAAVTMITGCPSRKDGDDEKPPPPPAREVVVVDDFQTIKDGAAMSYKVPKGSYRVEVTASNDGASITWTGADCQGAAETKIYNSNCTLTRDGQVQVGNPTTFGLGASTTVTVKITKLPGSPR